MIETLSVGTVVNPLKEGYSISGPETVYLCTKP